MEIQAFLIILLLVLLHILVLGKSNSKEDFKNITTKKFKPVKFFCGDCFHRKTKSECINSLTGKYCNIPCKWSKTLKHGPDGTRTITHFCEEHNPFYKIRKFW